MYSNFSKVKKRGVFIAVFKNTVCESALSFFVSEIKWVVFAGNVISAYVATWGDPLHGEHNNFYLATDSTED